MPRRNYAERPSPCVVAAVLYALFVISVVVIGFLVIMHGLFTVLMST